MPVRGELQSGKVLNRPGGAVLAGNPFGIVESEAARFGGDRHPGVKDFARGLGGVHEKADMRSGAASGKHRRDKSD